MGKLALGFACALATLGAASPAAAAVTTKRVEIPVADGTLLRGTLRLPDGAERRPAIVELTPYSGAQGYAREARALVDLAEKGYATLLVDVRGTGTSSGDFCFLCAQEPRDGADVVEWVARQPFSNGKVGMMGYSYGAVLAARTATLRPPHLAAIAAGSTYNDAYRDIAYPGGMMSADSVGLAALFSGIPYSRFNRDAGPEETPPRMLDAAGRRTTMAQQALEHPTADAYWEERSLQRTAERIEVPALFFTGWHDVYARGTPRTYRDAGSAEKALVVNTQGHLADQGLYEQSAARWFDAHLRTRPGAARSLALAAIPRVLLYDQGEGAGWRAFDHWVPPHAERVLRLCPQGRPPTGPWVSGGVLAQRPCTGTAAVPATPFDPTAGTSIVHDAGDESMHDALDQRLAPATAAFAGEPLDRSLTLTGPLAVTFTARTAGTDADWSARLVDIAPDGATKLVARGWLKASHRREDPAARDLFHTHTNPERLTPGALYDVSVEVWPTAYRLAAGHRIGVLLTAADTQKVLPTGESAASEIVVTPDRPATVTLPVRRDPGEPVKDPVAALASLPPTDAEPCRPAFGRARLVAGPGGARAVFAGAPGVVAETVAGDGRVVARRTVASGDLVWDGAGADGAYTVRLVARAGDGVTVRRLALRRRGARLFAGPRFERDRSCGVVRSFAASRPSFDGKPLTARYELGRAARVRLDVLRGGRVVRRGRVARRAAGVHRSSVSPRGLRAGRHTLRLVVRTGRRVARAGIEVDR